MRERNWFGENVLETGLARLFGELKAPPITYEAKTVNRLLPVLKEATPSNREFLVKFIKTMSKRLSRPGRGKTSR